MCVCVLVCECVCVCWFQPPSTTASCPRTCARMQCTDSKPQHDQEEGGTAATIDKAKEQLGYKPHTSLDIGVAEFVDWYKKEKERANISELSPIRLK